ASGAFHDKGLAGASHHAVIPNVNTVETLREVWPRLSGDERRLFDVIARSYLAAMMPDFRYRQNTVSLDVRGHLFRATGRQPVDLGWRAAFPEWQPAEEKGEDAQLLPALRHGETARLHDAAVEDKETRPPPRYNEGTLIEAMQNAWRFVAEEALRERLKEAKGIGTPATRAEIIRGLKSQDFLIADGKHVVPTARGLSLFAVLERADPALVDPGVTAQMERLLDEVLVGQQEMMGAIDAVCAQASRIIGRLQEGAGSADAAMLGGTARGQGADRPPTPAMKRYVDNLARQKGLAPPRGYTTSGSACRTFLDQHAPRKDAEPATAGAGGGASGEDAVPARAAVHRNGAGVPPVRPDGVPSARLAKPRSKAAARRPKPDGAGVRRKRPGKAAEGSGATEGDTPLRIPFGNKEAALRLGARYRAGGWFAPPGADLAGFRERGWL
ncbi:MAG TPA: DNA topoisomerase, partial [Falsiroseomonas sp.]|nr:DNA topoisomerase [Falsiroseomonas sp.]